MASESRNPEAREAIDLAIEHLNETVDILMWLHDWDNVECSTLMQADELHGLLMSILANMPDALDRSTKNVLTRLAQQKSGLAHGRRWRD
jgi:hypothetical protein